MTDPGLGTAPFDPAMPPGLAAAPAAADRPGRPRPALRAGVADFRAALRFGLFFVSAYVLGGVLMVALGAGQVIWTLAVSLGFPLVALCFLFWTFLGHMLFAPVMGLSTLADIPSSLEALWTREGLSTIVIELAGGGALAVLPPRPRGPP